jgi:pimeloyl-ACP methyl ester carboxylesterase
MTTQHTVVEERDGRSTGTDARQRLLAGLPVAERRLQLAGVSTAILVGGNGPPVVLLHGPGANAGHWLRVIPELVTTHTVIAPDLPGQGASEVSDGELDAGRVMAWLGELIEQSCTSPPTLVGYALGGAIAARFASAASDPRGRLGGLVLVDTLGLRPFEPAPEFGLALHGFLAQPTEHTHDELWRYCARNLDVVRQRLGERWEPFAAYNLDRARSATVQSALGVLMEQFGLPAIPPAELERITVPVALIWGRHDLATPVQVAEAASARYGWPLRVIEDTGDDPAIEQPEAFVDALRGMLGRE